MLCVMLAIPVGIVFRQAVSEIKHQFLCEIDPLAPSEVLVVEDCDTLPHLNFK